MSRILYVQSTLVRTSTSKVANRESLSLLEICSQLLKPLRETLEDKDKLNELEESFLKMELREIPDISSDDSELSFSEKEGLKIKSSIHSDLNSLDTTAPTISKKISPGSKPFDNVHEKITQPLKPASSHEDSS